MPSIHVRRNAVISINHAELLNHKANWEALPEVKLQSGDVLIKHVWGSTTGASHHRSPVEKMIRVGGMLNIFDQAGSQSAEHAALVGEVNGRVRLFEAEGKGIRTKTGNALAQLVANTAYSVFRLDGEQVAKMEGMQMLCDGMATRLAEIEGFNPCPVHLPRYEQVPQDNLFREVVASAHMPCFVNGERKQQSALYSWFRLASPLFPTIIPDSVLSHHDRKVLDFIKGKRENIRYICSGFVATILHAWYINYYNKRVFIDSSTVHPTALEHHLMKGHLGGFRRIGRHGGAAGLAH